MSWTQDLRISRQTPSPLAQTASAYVQSVCLQIFLTVDNFTFMNSLDKTEFSCFTPHQRSATVSVETKAVFYWGWSGWLSFWEKPFSVCSVDQHQTWLKRLKTHRHRPLSFTRAPAILFSRFVFSLHLSTRRSLVMTIPSNYRVSTENGWKVFYSCLALPYLEGDVGVQSKSKCCSRFA